MSVASQLNDNDEFDSYVIVASNLETDLAQLNLSDHFGDLKLLKNVKKINFFNKRFKHLKSFIFFE